MTSRSKTDALIRDIAKLVVKYPARDWKALLDQLSHGGGAQANVAAVIWELLSEAAEAKSGRRGQAQRGSVKKSMTSQKQTGVKKIEGEGEFYSLARRETLVALEKLLESKGVLPSVADIRNIYLSSGGKSLEAKSRNLAILELLRHLDSVPDPVFQQALEGMRQAKPTGSDDAYARWFNLILPREPGG